MTGGFPTMEAVALAQVRNHYPGLRRRGFSTAVREACGAEVPGRIPIIHISNDT